jgi:putative FmdB family regulatory protein
MPLFVFRCERCGQREDRFYPTYRQMVAEPAVRCLACGNRTERQATAPAFKVEGFAASNGYAKEPQ